MCRLIGTFYNVWLNKEDGFAYYKDLSKNTNPRYNSDLDVLFFSGK